MPWVLREPNTRQTRLRRRLQRWRYDHNDDLRVAAIGCVCALATLLGLSLTGFI